MTYQATWTNSASSGRLAGGVSTIMLSDPQELASAINRRRLLTYRGEQSFTTHIYSGAGVRRSLLATAVYPPLDSFRLALLDSMLDPPTGGLGGQPATPAAMEWLWPIGDGDENKPILSGMGGVPSGKVGLLPKINGSSNWTDPSLTPGQTHVRAVHFNELRSAIEFISRGRWVLPIYFCAGLFSVLPDSSWAGEFVANNGEDELRSVGYCVFRTGSTPPLGLTNVTVRSESYMELTAGEDCQLEVRHCLRPLDWENHPPTWNKYNPGTVQAGLRPELRGRGTLRRLEQLI